MHIHVDQPHLGVGNLPDRLPVDPDQLQQRLQGEPGVERAGHDAHQTHVDPWDPLAAAHPERLDQLSHHRRFEPALPRRLPRRP